MIKPHDRVRRPALLIVDFTTFSDWPSASRDPAKGGITSSVGGGPSPMIAGVRAAWSGCLLNEVASLPAGPKGRRFQIEVCPPERCKRLWKRVLPIEGSLRRRGVPDRAEKSGSRRIGMR